jgi:outer membrane protein TolC
MKKLLLFVCCAAATSGYAQQKISLTDAINIALKNSYDIQLAQNNIEISSLSNSYGYTGGLPVVSGTASDNEQVTSINQNFPTLQEIPNAIMLPLIT